MNRLKSIIALRVYVCRVCVRSAIQNKKKEREGENHSICQNAFGIEEQER